MDKASTLLMNGAAHIERCGWWQASSNGPGWPAVCAGISITKFLHGTPASVEAVKRLAVAIGGKDYLAITLWNDAPERTAE